MLKSSLSLQLMEYTKNGALVAVNRGKGKKTFSSINVNLIWVVVVIVSLGFRVSASFAINRCLRLLVASSALRFSCY